VDNEWQHHPYITNVNEDSQLSGVIKHTLSKGRRFCRCVWFCTYVTVFKSRSNTRSYASKGSS